jgi:D-sedoheptulose 7-phosphate isomerase
VLQKYLTNVIVNLRRLEERDFSQRLQAATDAIVRALSDRKAVLVAGNGGSAADAQHIAAELVGRFLRERPAYNVIALPANVAALTAVGNDYGFDDVFSRQVEAYGQAGGVLIAISTSGNSTNVVRAAQTARDLGMTVIGLTGGAGGLLRDQTDILFDVPSDVTPHIQEMHICIYHVLCHMVEDALAGGER